MPGQKQENVEPLNARGLSVSARRHLSKEIQSRIASAWLEGRALILNSNKPNYSEAFTIDAQQYQLVRHAVLSAITLLDPSGEPVLLKDVVAAVQARLGSHRKFPNGRMTNYTRYVKTDLEARGEIERVQGSSPQRIRRL